jgi:phosphoribosylformylglycinamidine synthase
MKAAVIVFPGSNRDRDMIEALTRTTGRPPLTVWHRDTGFDQVDLIVIPGGFTYGDYLRAGAMATHSPVMAEVRRRAEAGVPTLGVCNGFQILTEAGMLPGALMRNAGLKFVCRDVHIRVEDSQSPFTGGYEAGQVLRVPVAHHDGNYFADPETLDRLEQAGRVAFRYTTPQGDVTDAANPNGSARNIAGIFNQAKTVLGLMPHPENATEALIGGIDGQALFDGLAAALA